MGAPQREFDIYKDTPLRYLGYANEVGESLRGFVGSKWVNFSYGVATLYVIADAIDKTGKTYTRSENSPKRVQKTIYAATDTLIWQMLASVIIPGYTINRVCAFSDYLLKKRAQIKSNNRKKLIVTCIGLAVIPFIIKPIDNLVDLGLDHTLRKFSPYK